MYSVCRVFLNLLVVTSLVSACDKPRYDPAGDAEASFKTALSESMEAGRHLMVVFGADWCPDCRKLYENLNESEVRAFMGEHMDYLTIDVGDKDRNIEFAAGLGVSISNGIPVAVFFDPTGSAIGTTNEGQLEPSRYLTSRQILRFVEAVVNERRITRPVRSAQSMEAET